MEGPLFYYHWNAGEVKKESWQHNKQAFDEHSFTSYLELMCTAPFGDKKCSMI